MIPDYFVLYFSISACIYHCELNFWCLCIKCKNEIGMFKLSLTVVFLWFFCNCNLSISDIKLYKEVRWNKGIYLTLLLHPASPSPDSTHHRANCTIQAMAASDKVFVAALLLMSMLSISHRGNGVCSLFFILWLILYCKFLISRESFISRPRCLVSNRNNIKSHTRNFYNYFVSSHFMQNNSEILKSANAFSILLV